MPWGGSPIQCKRGGDAQRGDDPRWDRHVQYLLVVRATGMGCAPNGRVVPGLIELELWRPPPDAWPDLAQVSAHRRVR